MNTLIARFSFAMFVALAIFASAQEKEYDIKVTEEMATTLLPNGGEFYRWTHPPTISCWHEAVKRKPMVQAFVADMSVILDGLDKPILIDDNTKADIEYIADTKSNLAAIRRQNKDSAGDFVWKFAPDKSLAQVRVYTEIVRIVPDNSTSWRQDYLRWMGIMGGCAPRGVTSFWCLPALRNGCILAFAPTSADRKLIRFAYQLVPTGASRNDIRKLVRTHWKDVQVAPAALPPPVAIAPNVNGKRAVTTEADAVQEMNGIVLKSKEDPQEVRAYLLALLAVPVAIEGEISTSGPIVEKYSAIGYPNIGLLLSAADGPRINSSHARYMRSALTLLSKESELTKPYVIASLAKHPEFLEAVVKYHWERDCAPTILTMMRDAQSGRFPQSEFFLHAAVNLTGAGANPLLMQVFRSSRRKGLTLREFEDFPLFDFATAAAAAWAEVKAGMWKDRPESAQGFDDLFYHYDLAPIAAKYGVRDALYFCLDMKTRPKELGAKLGVALTEEHARLLSYHFEECLEGGSVSIPIFSQKREALLYVPAKRMWTLPKSQ